MGPVCKRNAVIWPEGLNLDLAIVSAIHDSKVLADRKMN